MYKAKICPSWPTAATVEWCDQARCWYSCDENGNVTPITSPKRWGLYKTKMAAVAATQSDNDIYLSVADSEPEKSMPMPEKTRLIKWKD
jgi:hypothetical protein